MKRVHNFYAGPAGLPLEALQRAKEELLDFENTGMSIMETSHRSKAYDKVHNEAISLLRELMGIPENYSVLFLQGGASMQFAMIPMNFIPEGGSADYINTGVWSTKAIKEAKIVADCNETYTSTNGFKDLPDLSNIKISDNAAYVHMTSNNTIYGTQFNSFPDTGKTPLICDMSSDILSRKVDVSKFGMIYAGAQKNLGPSGVTILIIRNDLIENANKTLPTYFKYSTHADKNSLFNTAPTFGIYILRNVLLWMKGIGGVEEIEKINTAKADAAYSAFAASEGYYKPVANSGFESKMNITFRLKTEELEKKFIADAEANDFIGCKGHRDAGGIRISTYNAVSLESVQEFVKFMDKFRNENK